MGFKRKPFASLLDLIDGQLRKDVLGKSQPKLPPPPSKPQLPPDQVIICLTAAHQTPPTPVQPADPKRKRSAKGKDLVDGGRSRTSQEEDEGCRALKQLRIAHQG